MKEALKLALEALEDNQHLVADNERHAYVMEYNDLIEKCKEALANHTEDNLEMVEKQEPVAWITQGGKGWLRWHKSYDDNKNSVPLYTTPPQRTWVGLTDEDLANCDDTELKQALYWEQILKEKNNG